MLISPRPPADRPSPEPSERSHMHIYLKVAAVLAAVGLAIYLAVPSLFYAALPLLILAACPLSMLLMMKMMSGGKKIDSASESAADGSATVSRDEAARLQARIDRLEAEQGGDTAGLSAGQRRHPLPRS